ncbi:hypothetical protein [Microbacterium aureliae]
MTEAPPAAPTGLLPRFKGEELPEFNPVTPAGGWTPATARAAATAYAHAVDSGIPHITVDRIADAAYFALRRSVPGLHGADLLDRLQRARAASPGDVVTDTPGVIELPPF